MLSLFRPLRPDRDELRRMVDRLPLQVRIAMLQGVRRERIIAGAYADATGGVCPMLAAHRHGARFAMPDFGRLWDEFAEAPLDGLRTAKPTHVAVLADVLEHSIERDLRAGGADDPAVLPAGPALGAAPGAPADEVSPSASRGTPAPTR